MFVLEKNIFGEDRFIIEGKIYVGLHGEKTELQVVKLELEKEELLSENASLILQDYSTTFEDGISKPINDYFLSEFGLEIYDQTRGMFKPNFRAPTNITLSQVEQVITLSKVGFYNLAEVKRDDFAKWIAILDARIAFPNIDDRLSKKWDNRKDAETGIYRCLFEKIRYNYFTMAVEFKPEYYLNHLNGEQKYFVEMPPNIIAPNPNMEFSNEWILKIEKLFNLFKYKPIEFIELKNG